MTWFKVDDSLAFHAKAVAAGNAAMGMWVRAGAWCSQQLTDGHVPAHMVPALGRPSEAKRLCDVGLWLREDDGYRFWQWGERNPLRHEVEDDRSAARERMRKARDAKRSPEQSANGRANFDRSAAAVAVTPTRPDPSLTSTKSESPPRPPAAEPSGFAEFYLAYPRKVGRVAAVKAYSKAMTLTEPGVLLAAVQRFATSMQGRDPKYIPHPATWLNAGRWDDEPEQVPHAERELHPHKEWLRYS